MKKLLAVLALLLAISLIFLVQVFDRSPSTDPQGHSRAIRILVVGDPFAAVLDREVSHLLRSTGYEVRIDRAGYDAMRKTILIEGEMESAGYDIVSFDSLWTPELAQAKVLLALDDWQKSRPEVAADLYLNEAMRSVRWQGATYGLPIQPHAELLWYRRDLLNAHQLQPPRSLAELIECAKQLHQPKQGLYGIVWNGQRGSALGQTISHLYAAMGSTIVDSVSGPQIDSPAGLQVLTLLQELVLYSPPDILTTAWDQRRQRYLSGHVAMVYGWGARMAEGLLGPSSEVTEVTAVTSAPMAEGAAMAIPFGTWNLGILRNVSEQRQQDALQVLEILCGATGARHLVLSGNAGVPMRHLFNDPQIPQTLHPMMNVMAEVEKHDGFSSRARPPTPLWNDLSVMLGSVFHDALRGELSNEEALQRAQQQADLMWQQHQTQEPTVERP